jgi:hypothetical protein
MTQQTKLTIPVVENPYYDPKKTITTITKQADVDV